MQGTGQNGESLVPGICLWAEYFITMMTMIMIMVSTCMCVCAFVIVCVCVMKVSEEAERINFSVRPIRIIFVSPPQTDEWVGNASARFHVSMKRSIQPPHLPVVGGRVTRHWGNDMLPL